MTWLTSTLSSVPSATHRPRVTAPRSAARYCTHLTANASRQLRNSKAGDGTSQTRGSVRPVEASLVRELCTGAAPTDLWSVRQTTVASWSPRDGRSGRVWDGFTRSLREGGTRAGGIGPHSFRSLPVVPAFLRAGGADGGPVGIVAPTLSAPALGDHSGLVGL